MNPNLMFKGSVACCFNYHSMTLAELLEKLKHISNNFLMRKNIVKSLNMDHL